MVNEAWNLGKQRQIVMDDPYKLNDEKWMGRALELAAMALSNGEFPVGCIIVSAGRVVGKGARLNSRGPCANELDHAEIVALRDWAERTNGVECGGREGSDPLTAYCTLEPCLMCLGALILNGIKRIVFAYEDVMGGACLLVSSKGGLFGFYDGSLYKKADIKIIGGIKRAESLALFKAFFSDPSNSYWQDSPLARYTMGG